MTHIALLGGGVVMLFTVEYFKEKLDKSGLSNEETAFAFLRGIVQCDMTDQEIVQALKNVIQAVDELN